MTAAIVLLSGGKDSTIALWWAGSRFRKVSALSIDYPERPRQEKLAAQRLAERAGARLVTCSLPFIETLRSIKSSGDRKFGTRNAYIPMRNALFYTTAVYYAESLGITDLVGGQLKSDAIAYEDARECFLKSLVTLYQRVTMASALELHLPLAHMPDADAVQLGHSLGVPFDLTWSCLEDGDKPCLTCVSCRDRAELI